MNYGRIYYCDVANGPGMRTAVFVSGCTHHCRECFNPETWDFDFGEEYTDEIMEKVVASLAPGYITGLTILGGEPMEKPNQPAVYRTLKLARERFPEKSLWIYSGYTFEELTDPENRRTRTEYTDKILALLDVLVDGEFVIEKKNIRLHFRGSENQRILDMPKTLEAGRPVLHELDENAEKN